MKRLQRFDFKLSRYERPNQRWVCARKDCGAACPMGPDDRGGCRATSECQPHKTGDRWSCTRPAIRGGKCPDGPLPDGSCCRPIPKCVPKRSVRAQRGLAVTLVVVVTLGALALLFGRTERERSFSPGPLTSPHASADINCANCHTAAVTSAGGWMQASVSKEHARGDSERCLACHNLGAQAMQPHGLPPSDRAALTTAVTAHATHGALASNLAGLLGQPPRDAEGNLACATCHREHHGTHVDLTKLTNENCNSCHAAKFASFASGHPSFADYPYKRRTRISFDHNGHINNYFMDAANKDKAPAQCNSCHEADGENRFMLVRNYETTCSACHNENISKPGSKGLEVLRIPGLDKKFVAEKAAVLGQWPEDADGAVTPFMQFLLAKDEKATAALAVLKDADLLDVASAAPPIKAATEQLAWSIKELVADLITSGHDAMKNRLGDTTGATFGQLPPESALAFTRSGWWPGLLAEVSAHREGKPLPAPPPPAAAPKAAVKPPPAKPAAPKPADDGDILGGDTDILSGVPATPEPSKATAATTAAEPLAPENWVSTGGWNVGEGNFTLHYRPTGHADPFLKAWLDLGAREAATPALATAFQALGEQSNCLKCHSTDAAGNGAVQVNWKPAIPTPNRHRFTEFSHGAHFSLLDEKGCQTCHQINPKADYTSAFKDNVDPRKFVSSFDPLQHSVCAQCHTPQAAGANCQICHRYHVGDFAPTISKAARLLRMQKSEAPAAAP